MEREEDDDVYEDAHEAAPSGTVHAVAAALHSRHILHKRMSFYWGHRRGVNPAFC